MFKKVKYLAENYYYTLFYKKPIDINTFKIQTNTFSSKPLKIIYLTHFDGPFSINNTLKPMEELGAVFKFELDASMDRKNWYSNKEKRNQEMLKFVQTTIKNHKIDVIVCYLSGFSTTPEILQKIQAFNIPMINESLDDERKFRSKKGKDGIYKGTKDICKYFNLSLTTSKGAIVKYIVEKGTPLYKEYAGNEKIYRNLQLQKIYDVAFVGANYGIRSKYIKFLEDNGVSVYARGAGWENGFTQDDEMIEIFNKAKIVLGFATVGKNDNIYILKGRDFEVPLTGSFYITGYHEELKEYFDIGKHIETYRSKEELLEKVTYYLAHVLEREKISMAGYELCVQHHTAKQSYKKVFGYLGL